MMSSAPRAPPGSVRSVCHCGLGRGPIDRRRNEASPAANALVATYADLVEEGPVAALSALAAYETQASAIASSKAEGLRRWYGIDEAGTAFWDVHATIDADHGDWAIDALTRLDADPAVVAQGGQAGRGCVVGVPR